MCGVKATEAAWTLLTDVFMDGEDGVDYGQFVKAVNALARLMDSDLPEAEPKTNEDQIALDFVKNMSAVGP